MTNPIGPLTATDEDFCHQIADTFAVVGSTDLSWTEKVCASAFAKDGSLQLGFGLGKYNNRNVMDAYAGTSRGVEQMTVRASRRLAPSPSAPPSGPSATRSWNRCAASGSSSSPTTCSPSPSTGSSRRRSRRSSRTARTSGPATGSSAELVRYHQIGRCSGWIDIDGERDRDDPRDVGLDPRPLVGRALRRGRSRRPTSSRRPRIRTGRTTSSGPRAARTPRRRPLRRVHGHEPLPTHRARRQVHLGDVRAPRRQRGTHGRHHPRARLRPDEPSAPGRPRPLHHGRRLHADAAGRGGLRHGLPPRNRALLRVRRPPPR